MQNATDSTGHILPDSLRLTPFGQKLRSSSLDELPELWNVLKGDMSLVGPRPLLPEYLPLYTPRQARRHDVKPGITGWAQINGRDELPIEVKAKFDGEYVNRIGFFFDVKIIFLTFLKVIKKEGIKTK